MKYCEFCGKELQDNENCNCEEAVAAAEKKEKKTIQIVALVFGVILLVSVVVSLISQAAKVNPLDYTTVTFSGLNGAGTVEVDFNEDELIDAIIGEEPDSFEGLAEWAEKYDAYSEGIDYTIKPSEELSNGDKVEIRFSVVGSASGKVKRATKTFTVENLPEAEVVDIFKDVEFEMSGISGDGRLKIRNNSQNEFAKNCTLSADNEYNLTNGDEITITIEFTEYDSKEFASIPKETTKKITVSGLPEFMGSKDISKDLINDIKTNFETKELSSLEERKEAKFKSLSYVGTYFYTPTHDPDTIPSKLIAIYSADRYSEYGNFDEKVYLSLEYRGDVVYKEENYDTLVVFPDGSNNVLHEDLYVDVDAETLDEVLKGHCLRYFSEPYTYEKID